MVKSPRSANHIGTKGKQQEGFKQVAQDGKLGKHRLL